MGTIEIVILRCKSEGEQVPTPLLAPKDFGPRSFTATQPTRTKSATPAPSDYGGLGGLFDGANDYPESISSKELIYDHFADTLVPRRFVSSTIVAAHDKARGRPVQPRDNRDDRSNIHAIGNIEHLQT